MSKKKLPDHYSLVQEHPDSYEIHDSRDDSRFHVAKEGLKPSMHDDIASIPMYAEGTTDGPITVDVNATPPDQVPDQTQPTDKGSFTDVLGLADPSPVQTQVGTPTLTDPNAIPDQVEPNQASTTTAPTSDKVGATQAAPIPGDGVPQAQIPAQKSPLDPTGVNSVISDVQNLANAQIKAAKDNQVAWNTYLSTLNNSPDIQQTMKDYQKKNDDLMAQVQSQKVDPNRYWNSKSTGQKIATGIGLALSGIGAGMTGQPNLAMEMINKQIDRDIDAQKSSNENTLNLWRINQSSLNSRLEAEAMTKNQALAMVQAQVARSAAALGTPQAKLQSDQLIMGLRQQQAANNFYLGMASGSPMSEDQAYKGMQVLGQIKPEAAKDMEKRYVPGLGIARTPLTDDNRKALTKYDQLTKQIDDAIDFAKNTGTTIPGSDNNARAASKRSDIILSMNDLHGLSRLNEQELKMYGDQVPDPGQFRTSAAIAKLQEIKDATERQKKAEMVNLGIVPFTQSPIDQVAVNWAKMHLNKPELAPKAQAILKANGM